MAPVVPAPAARLRASAGSIRAEEISAALAGLGVGADDSLYVHSSLRACARMQGDGARAKAETVLDGLWGAVSRGALMLPTYSYSFCRGEEYDVDASPSDVGALSEIFRRSPGVRRTLDPIFSAAVRGILPDLWERRLFKLRDVECFGPESIFAYLAEQGGKLLFFGVGFEYCTFLHHLEWRLGVGYRYLKRFDGIVRAHGVERRVAASYFVRDLGRDTTREFAPLGDLLLKRGAARCVRLHDGPELLVVEADEILPILASQIAANPDYLLASGQRRAA